MKTVWLGDESGWPFPVAGWRGAFALLAAAYHEAGLGLATARMADTPEQAITWVLHISAAGQAAQAALYRTDRDLMRLPTSAPMRAARRMVMDRARSAGNLCHAAPVLIEILRAAADNDEGPEAARENA